MEALLLSLLLWINQNSTLQYDINQGLPKLKAASQMTLATVIIDDDATLAKEKNSRPFQNFINQLEAVYKHDEKTILISSKIDLESAYARSVIVHELVHFIQYQQKMNEKVACLNALERDAYELQARYMDRYDIPKNFDTTTVFIRSMCGHFGS